MEMNDVAELVEMVRLGERRRAISAAVISLEGLVPDRILDGYQQGDVVEVSKARAAVREAVEEMIVRIERLR
jgi:hypothetical protein